MVSSKGQEGGWLPWLYCAHAPSTFRVWAVCEHGAEAVCPSYRLHLNHLLNTFFFPSLNVVFLHAFATFFITSACVGYG